VVHDAFARGGMATIHFARLLGQQGFTRTIAVKHLFPHLSADESFVAMFLEEARLLSRVRHPNVVAPLDIIGFDTELFIAMEYVHGQPVSFLCSAHQGPVPARLASAILTQVLLGLHAVHEATSETGQPLGIVHRDVSPQNILIDLDGIARLVDFGIAKAASRGQTLSTARGLLKGKLGYLAPEQLTGQGVDRRTDVYMAGIVLWELLTGRRLFVAETPSAMFELLAAGGVSPPSAIVPDLPAALNAVVLRALALNKEQRFENARAMAAALAQAAPPAATIELGIWAEAIAGPELRKRATRIAEIETLDLNPAALAPQAQRVTERIQPLLHKTQPIPTPSRAAPPSALPAQGAVTEILFAPTPSRIDLNGRAPAEAGPELPDTRVWEEPHSEAPGSSAAVRAEVTPLPPLPLRGGLSRRSKLLLGTAAAALIALVVALGIHRAARWRAAEQTPPSLEARTPAALAPPVVSPPKAELPTEPALPPAADGSLPAEPARAEPSAPEITRSEARAAVVPREPAARTPSSQTPHGPVARRPARVNVSSANPAPATVRSPAPQTVRNPAPATVRNPAPQTAPANRASVAIAKAPAKPDCAVPYRVDGHGIKRFRAECF
jgi:serine/threonine-protein kinase